MNYCRMIGTLFAVPILIGGCSHLQLRKPFHSRNGDWNMYGGEIGRKNRSPGSISPPLRLMWEYDAGSGFSSFPLSLADSILFIGTLSGEVHAVSAATGKGKGSCDFGSAVYGTPVVDGDQLYVALGHDEDGFVSYNLSTARTDWKLRTGDIETAPLLLDQRLIIATLKNGVMCVEKTSGMIVWKFEIPAAGHAPMIHSSPASDGTTIVFGSDDGTLYAIGADDGKLRWKAKTGAAILASPTISNGKVFVGSLDRCFYAFSAAEGTPLWKQPLGAAIYSPQAVDDHYVYVGTVGRTFFALEINAGSVAWKFTTNGAMNSAPVVSRDIVYFGSIDRNLYALNCTSGELVWKYQTEGRIKSTPIIRGEQVFVPVEDHFVLAFTPETAP